VIQQNQSFRLAAGTTIVSLPLLESAGKLTRLLIESLHEADRCIAILRDAASRSLETNHEMELIETSPEVTMATDRLLTITEVGKMLGVTANTIRSMRAEGRIPKPVPISKRRIMYRESDLTAWLANGGFNGARSPGSMPR
jgi:excisionase family DNA binding protein